MNDRLAHPLDEVDALRPGDPPWRSRHAHRHLPEPVAAMLRSARSARRWSLREAAKRTGVSTGMLVHLEKGRRLPSVPLAEDLIAGYGLSPWEAGQLRAVALPDVGRGSPYRTRL